MIWILGLGVAIILLIIQLHKRKTLYALMMGAIVLAFAFFTYFNQREEKWVLAFTNPAIDITPSIQIIEQDEAYYQTVKIKEQVKMLVPVLSQFPELVRGCEVTSLAMLLQFYGYQANKMTLAEQIIKEPTPYEVKDGRTFFGHPNDGFVGDMMSYNKPGLGVYHKPITELAQLYAGKDVIDLTNEKFVTLQTYLSLGYPIWVIINTTYDRLPSSAFETWETPSGPVSITYREHSVVITGYDDEFIYFNDPLTGTQNKKAPISAFLDAWVQMGSQAVTIYPQKQ